MKTSVVATVTIDANREQVFKYLESLKYHYLWNPHLQDISSNRHVKVGMVYETIHTLLGIRVTSKNHVLKLVPNQELEVEVTTGLFDNHVNFLLKSKQGRTQVICTTVVSTKGEAFAFSRPVLKMLVRRELQSDLQALKVAAEHRLS